MQSRKESQRASLGTCVSVQTHPILIHVHKPSQINRAISLTLKDEQKDIISCIPLNLWLLVICIAVLKGSKYSLLGKICYCWTQKHADYRKKIPGLPLNVFENVSSLCHPAHRNTRVRESFCCIVFLSTQRTKTLHHVCCPPHHCLQELYRLFSNILGFLMKDRFILCGFLKWQAQ